VLLGHVIERASGQPYGAFLGREIFEPLGMAATFNGDPGDQPRLAAGHHDGTAVASFALDTVGLGTGSPDRRRVHPDRLSVVTSR